MDPDAEKFLANAKSLVKRLENPPPLVLTRERIVKPEARASCWHCLSSHPLDDWLLNGLDCPTCGGADESERFTRAKP